MSFAFPAVSKAVALVLGSAKNGIALIMGVKPYILQPLSPTPEGTALTRFLSSSAPDF